MAIMQTMGEGEHEILEMGMKVGGLLHQGGGTCDQYLDFQSIYSTYTDTES